MNLYQLTAEQQAMSKKLEFAGFDEQTIADTLEGEENTEALKEKRLGYIAIIKMKRAMAVARTSAAAAIAELAERETEAADRLESTLMKSMIQTNDMDLIGLEFEAHIQGKVAPVLINDLSKVPAQYMRTPEPTIPKAAPDKKAIGQAIANGEIVDGCTLGANKKIVIK
jgi:hypothetical protein